MVFRWAILFFPHSFLKSSHFILNSFISVPGISPWSFECSIDWRRRYVVITLDFFPPLKFHIFLYAYNFPQCLGSLEKSRNLTIWSMYVLECNPFLFQQTQQVVLQPEEGPLSTYQFFDPLLFIARSDSDVQLKVGLLSFPHKVSLLPIGNSCSSSHCVLLPTYFLKYLCEHNSLFSL